MPKATSLIIYLIIVGVLEIHSSPPGAREDGKTSPRRTTSQVGRPPTNRRSQTKDQSPPPEEVGGGRGADDSSTPKATPEGGVKPQENGAGTVDGKPSQEKTAHGHDGGKGHVTDHTPETKNGPADGGGKSTDTQNGNTDHKTAHGHTADDGNRQGAGGKPQEHKAGTENGKQDTTTHGPTDNDRKGQGAGADGEPEAKPQSKENDKSKEHGTGAENGNPEHKTPHNPTADAGTGHEGGANKNPPPPSKTDEAGGGASQKPSETSDGKRDGHQGTGVDESGKKPAGDGGSGAHKEEHGRPNGGKAKESDTPQQEEQSQDKQSPVEVEHYKPKDGQTQSGKPKVEVEHYNAKDGQTQNGRPKVEVETYSASKGHGPALTPEQARKQDLEKQERRMKELLEKDITNMPEGLLLPKIKVRLVSKEWKPIGPSSKETRVMDFYEWDVADVQDAFESSSSYQSEERLLANAIELLSTDHYNKDHPCIVILDTVDAEKETKFLSKTVTALAMRNLHLVNNIFTIDLSELTHYMTSISFLYYMKVKKVNYFTLGKVIGDFFVAGMDSGLMTTEKINLVGFGFSARLAIYINMHIEDVKKEKIGSILGLNPSGSPGNPSGPLARRNARVVHVYHTNSFPVGTMARVGHADFTFNNGLVQPECKESKNPWRCSHKAVLDRFWYAILFGAKDFKARQCVKYFSFYVGDCDNRRSTLVTYPIVDTQVEGKFYLRTSGDPPYGLGDSGSLAVPGSREEFLDTVERKKGTDEAAEQDIETFKMIML